jgi:hypothetical protein
MMVTGFRQKNGRLRPYADRDAFRTGASMEDYDRADMGLLGATAILVVAFAPNMVFGPW